jgi:transposase
MAAWLLRCGIKTVAMESTGVYWISLDGVLEAHGVKPCLVNARAMKNVPGRRIDWHQCQWLQYLHSYGEVCAVRTVMRHGHDLVRMANHHISTGTKLSPKGTCKFITSSAISRV